MKRILKALERLAHRSSKEKEPATYSDVERAEYIFYINYLREGMNVFDVGANVGELTLLFSHFILNGTVHAFEASRSTFERLEQVCRASCKKNIVLNHQALSDKERYIHLNVYDEDYSGFNSQATRPMKNYGLDIEPVRIEEVRATTVDSYCESRKIKQIDLMKIDVEGAELQVMRGASDMLRSKRIKCIAFEFGQTTFDMGNRPEEIEDYLKEMDYKIRNLIEGDPIFPGRESVETAKFSMHIATT